MSAAALVAQYVHGLGLVSRADAAGTVAYYDFDAVGSTVDMTDRSSAVSDQCSYDPFGNVLRETQAITNLFTFLGEYGVIRDDTGLDYMQTRFYDPELGRFLSPDPLGLDGGDYNFYRSFGNNPVGSTDVLGNGIRDMDSLAAEPTSSVCRTRGVTPSAKSWSLAVWSAPLQPH